jgi:GntR family transcriptional regulator
VILAILDEIEAGKLIRADGSLPSETDLSERFGVSRATIRDALTRLEYAGIVIRRHGIGTYVNRLITNHPGAVQYWMDETASFGNLIRTSGHRPECRVISSSIIATGSYAAALNRNPQSQVLVAEKIFLSDGTPVIHCTDVVPSERIDPANLELAVSGDSCLESIYLFLETQCHSKVSFQESQVFATVADEKMAVLLDYPIGGALFRLEEVGYSAEMTPLFYGRVHFRGDAVSFLQVRRPAISIGSQSYDRYETESLLAEPVTDDPGR